jgi:hypothetical protein
MSGKKSNALRDYHLLVARGASGFEWQIRYDRHATPVQRSSNIYPTQEEAALAGEEALAAVRRAASDPATP